MTATYATQTFVCQLSTGGTHTVMEGSLRDTAHQAVVDHPALFSASGQPKAGVGHVDAKLAAYLAAYPGGC